VRAALSDSARVIAVVGLAREARIAEGEGVHAVIGGGDEAGLSDALRRALRQGAAGIVSFGISGGLDPALKPGACIVGSAVSLGRERWRTDAAWSKRLLAALPLAQFAEVTGIGHPAATVEHKRLLRSMTGAAAVDMESHVAGRIAAEAGLPLAILRIICDPADRSLPPAALAGMRRDGTTSIGAVLGAVLSRPAQLFAMIGLAGDARVAFSELKRRRASAGAGFALD
jgi:hopanoid-associated phosphorylase